MLKLLRSKMVWGAIAAAAGWLLSQPAITVTEIAQAVGAVLTAVGARDAIRKSAPSDSEEVRKDPPEA